MLELKKIYLKAFFKNAFLEKISKNKKTNFKYTFENGLKILRKKTFIVIGQININPIRDKFDLLIAHTAGNIAI